MTNPTSPCDGEIQITTAGGTTNRLHPSAASASNVLADASVLRRLAILVIAWLSLFARINTVPIEEHEAFVLQTAREMSHSGEWVLPYFSHQPRLNKPPLNYWLTLGIARLAGSDFEPWTGRMCSMLAALAVVLLTAYAGGKLFDARAGFLAALLLTGTRGFCGFSSHARPDFLYAVLCVFQLYAWIGAWRAVDGTRRQAGMAALGWAFAGLATLAKGPQVPAMFLSGTVLFLLFGEDRRRTLKVLRPFSGLLILLAITLPWWLLLKQRVRSAGIDLGHTQLSGSLLQTLSGWRGIMSLYYPIELLRLLLPSSLLLPLLVLRNRRSLAWPAGAARLMVCACLATLAAFTAAGHYRLHYMLPLLPPCILLGAGWISRTPEHPIKRWFWRGLAGAGVVALAACAGLLFWQRQYGALAWLTGCGAALFYLIPREIRSPFWQGHPLAAQLPALATMTILLMAGSNALPSRNRFHELDRNFAQSIANTLGPEDILATWKRFPDTLPYYVRNRVRLLDDPLDLKPFFDNKAEGRDVYLVMPRDEMTAVGGLFQMTRLATLENQKQPGRILVFMKIDGIIP